MSVPYAGPVPDAGLTRLRRPRRVAPPSSSGLGHRPFKAAARVRIPLGAPVSAQPGASAVPDPDRPWPVCAPVGTSRKLAAVHGGSPGRGVRCRLPVMGIAGSRTQPPASRWYCLSGAGSSILRYGPWGHASATVDVMRSCRAAWSARHPVKVEVAGSNPVGTAGYSAWTNWVSSQVR